MNLSEMKILGYLIIMADLYVVAMILTRRRSGLQVSGAVVMTVIIAMAGQLLLDQLTVNSELTLFLIGSLFCLPIIYMSKEHFTISLFVFFMVYVTNEYIRLIYSLLNEYIYQCFNPYLPMNYIYFGIIGLEILVLIRIYRYIIRSIKYILQTFKRGNYVVSLLPLGAGVTLIALYIRQNFDQYIFIGITAIATVLIVSFYLLNFTITITKESYNLERQLLLQQDHYKSLTESIQKNRVYRHDIRHHLAVISKFIENNDMSTMQHYLVDLQRQYGEDKIAEFCENKYIDAVLAHYCKIAKRNSLKLKLKFCIPAAFAIEPLDVCVIVGNCLEQAIAACSLMAQVNQAQISLNGGIVDNKLVITLEYSVGDAIAFNDKWLGNIKVLITKYAGDIQHTMVNDMAKLVIALKIPAAG